MIGFSRGKYYLAIHRDDTPPEHWPDRKVLKWDSMHYLKNNIALVPGDEISEEHLSYAPDPLQSLYVHVVISPGTNGTTSTTSGLPGAPSNHSGSTLNVAASIRFGAEATAPLFPITGVWNITLLNTSSPDSLQLRVTFAQGQAAFSFSTDGKPTGLWTVDDSNFASLPVLQNDLDAAGVSGDPGLWAAVLANPVFFDIYEE